MKTNQNINEMTVNELLAERNRIDAKIQMLTESISWENYEILLQGIRNLRDRVGNYYPEDYYTCSRLYINKNGIKNIRYGEDRENCHVIVVKLYSPKGMNIPQEITVDREDYIIDFIFSKNYEDTIDY